MGILSIGSYRVGSAGEAALLDLLREHNHLLRRLGMLTDRPAVRLRAGDGSILEVWEWTSSEAVSEAHSHPEVQAMWGRFAAVCEPIALSELQEAGHPFAGFPVIEG